MFDLKLLEDVKNFKIGADNIFEIGARYNEIKKIIKNRTKEKIVFLNYVLENNIVDYYTYKVFLKIALRDYIESKLVVAGLISVEQLQ